MKNKRYGIFKLDKDYCDFMIIRRRFTNTREWLVVKEGLRRGLWEIYDRVGHLTWEWIALKDIKK